MDAAKSSDESSIFVRVWPFLPVENKVNGSECFDNVCP